MDTQNYGLEKMTPALNMAIFGINSLNFWGCCICSLKAGLLFHPKKWHHALRLGCKDVTEPWCFSDDQSQLDKKQITSHAWEENI